ncbi:MAG: sulfatase/phosphatase domain-containing protein, partial [Opitutaceae bacterium]
AIPQEVQGASRADVLRDRATTKQPASWSAGPVVVEWHDTGHPEEEGRSLVTSEGWKLNLYRDDRPELFDLNRDPAELRNLAHDASHRDRIQALSEELQAWQQRNADSFPLPN